jgi:hypothetical protein
MNEFEQMKQNVARRINNMINPPKDALKKPHNRLWIALVAFNLIFFPLDAATGFTVGLVTRWYYGFFVFGAGFGTMVIHEALYSNPYAKFWQKVVSVLGFLTSITITATIGIAAIVVNVLFTGYDQDLYGVIMAGASFFVLFFHGLLIAVYYFADAGILARQKATASLANHEQLQTVFTMSEQIATRMNALESRLLSAVERGDGARMNASLKNLTGQDFLDGDGIPNYQDPDYQRKPTQPAYRNNGSHPEREPVFTPGAEK